VFAWIVLSVCGDSPLPPVGLDVLYRQPCAIEGVLKRAELLDFLLGQNHGERRVSRCRIRRCRYGEQLCERDERRREQARRDEDLDD
jgi:hypothetical protein